MSKRILARIVPLSSITVVLSGLGALGAPALAGYGSPIVERGHVVLGIVTRQFTRDIFDEEEDALSNPSDTFGFTALEGVMGLYRDRLDVGFELGRSENDQDRFPDRDYITWDYALKARGLLYTPADRRFELIGGLAYHESTDFDRSPSQTHKLEQNFIAHVTIGRRLEWQERWIRVYAGGIYSSHEFTEYGESASPSGRAAEGETRSNLLLLLGASARIVSAVEGSAEIEVREDLSWSLAAGYRF
jgi:hypothetical protein